jgi:branched-chain amino acid aminotransferase
VETRVFVDGRITPPAEAVVPVFDHGFLFGDSVYEVLWWHRGRPIQEREHLARLEESATRVYMDLQFSREEIGRAVRRTVEATGAGPGDDANIRIVVTRGVGPLGLDFSRVPRRTLIVVASPAERPTEEQFERGLSAAVVDRRRNLRTALDPRAKTGNYLNNVLALHEARRAGADDAIMLNDRGEVTEATTANLYAVRGGAISTPPLEAGILKGTTRDRILALARREGIEARERSLSLEDLRSSDEAFLSSSVRGVVAIVRLDGRAVGAGSPGPVTRRIRRLFEEAADAEAADADAGG